MSYYMEDDGIEKIWISLYGDNHAALDMFLTRVQPGVYGRSAYRSATVNGTVCGITVHAPGAMVMYTTKTKMFSDVCVVMFDVTNRQSFEAAKQKATQQLGGGGYTIGRQLKVFIGDKCDQANERQVQTSEVQQYIAELEDKDTVYFETAVNSDDANVNNVEFVFNSLVDTIVSWIPKREADKRAEEEAMSRYYAEQYRKVHKKCSIQ